MIDCRAVSARWSAYLDGELDELTGSALRGHLRTCAPCRALVEDGARVREVLRELPALDPPPSLWAAIEVGLGEAEIGDAGRSRWNRAWERTRRALRGYALPGAVAAVTVAAVTVAVLRAGRGDGPGKPVARDGDTPLGSASADSVDLAADVEPPQPGRGVDFDFAMARAEEVARADRRYLDTIEELSGLAAAERERWPEAVRSMFDRRLGALRAAVTRGQEVRVATTAGSTDPVPGRDALYVAYREQIAFLQKAAVGELTVARLEPR